MTKTNESIEINKGKEKTDKDIRMIEFDAGNEEEKSSTECLCVCVCVCRCTGIKRNFHGNSNGHNRKIK